MLREACTKPVVTLSPEAPISEAARLMQEKNIGTVVVVDGSRPRGIVTDRDIAVAVAADGRRPSAHVGEIMHANPAVIQEDQGIFDAVKLLSERGVRRLPVVDGQGRLTGIIALDDILMGARLRTGRDPAVRGTVWPAELHRPAPARRAGGDDACR